MNSNFRKYYYKDRGFYLKVIDAEEPGERGYSFKVNVFNVSKDPKEVKD